MLKRFLAAALVAAFAVPAAAREDARADYPTNAIADYVLGCMAANGQTRQALDRCSCSIDVVTTLIPYSRYEEASTFLSMGQVPGEGGVLFRTSPQSKAAIEALRRAQIEAELRCF